MDIITVMLQVINIPATLCGVAAVQLFKFFTPGPLDGERSLETMPGKIWDRLLPFVAPVTAIAATIGMEWYTVHPEIGRAGIIPADIVRGLLSGLASDYALRIYYKTIKGI